MPTPALHDLPPRPAPNGCEGRAAGPAASAARTSRRARATCAGLAAFALALLAACAQLPAPAPTPLPVEPGWGQPVGGHAGLRYERDDRQPGEVLHWLRLDLRDPTLRLTLSPPGERGRTLDRFDGAGAALAALNASFFSKTFEPRGWTVSQGEAWAPVMTPDDSPLIACDAASTCALQLRPPYAVSGSTWLAVAGTPWLIRDGQVRGDADDARCERFCAMPHPRTAIGLDRTGRYLTLVLAEGRRGPVAGLSLHRLAALMAARGVTQAFNLDGGGSTSLLIQGRAVMERPFNEPVPRPLANALMIRLAEEPAR
ncbi:MAG: phosphodiester glycosidase family protein [Mitsuaria chitosanitabida]|uniref:phosphodiester glycosidase family protein n=1 Tax=Roseateles chitosanitabidus TaxID=65048 RepID=UPI001B23D207|nr:phosphodiester glycosidase family protein [Roseateles chitosanitabidus]MBO9688329.1 phosphodiester glycosidase family protein [Roseateles chitosanitabidus]